MPSNSRFFNNAGSIANMPGVSSLMEVDERNTVMDDMALPSENFAVYSDPKFLYIIGKICAKNGSYLDVGLQALNDYLLILNYNQNEMETEQFE